MVNSQAAVNLIVSLLKLKLNTKTMNLMINFILIQDFFYYLVRNMMMSHISNKKLNKSNVLYLTKNKNKNKKIKKELRIFLKLLI